MSDTSLIPGSGTQIGSSTENTLYRHEERTSDDVYTGAGEQAVQGIPVRLKKQQLVVTLRFSAKTLEEQRETKELNERIKRRG